MRCAFPPLLLSIFFLIPFSPQPLFPFGSIKAEKYEIGVSAAGGLSLVGGAWRDGVDEFADDLGQKTRTRIFPAFAASVFGDMRFGGIWNLGLSLGAGSWGGRASSEGGSLDDRLSTIAGIGVELVPDAGVRLRFGPGEFGADLKLGFGCIASPLWVREAWADSAVTASYGLSFYRRLYFLTGADLSYAVPIKSYSVAALLSADFAFASFDSESGSSVLERFLVGVRVSRALRPVQGMKR